LNIIIPSKDDGRIPEYNKEHEEITAYNSEKTKGITHRIPPWGPLSWLEMLKEENIIRG